MNIHIVLKTIARGHLHQCDNAICCTVYAEFQAHIPLESQSEYQIYSHAVLAYSTHIWAIAGNVKHAERHGI